MFHNERKDTLFQQADKLELSQELNSAEEFIQLYYEKLDKQQYHLVSRLYLPESVLIWNGTSSTGNDNIQQFLSQLPQSTHTVSSVDMQRLQDNTNKKNFVVQTAGLARFKDYGTKPFFQTFITSLVGDKYKISIDIYRCPDGTP